MPVAFVFPGQGEQQVGMGKDILDAFPEMASVLDNAAGILGEDIGKLCFEGPYEDLTESRRSGLAVFLISSLILEIINQSSIRPSAYAGYSVGQYTALYAAGAVSFEHALDLVNFRGKCLKKAAMERDTGMLGVIGLPEQQVEDITASVGNAYVANYNSPGNYSVSCDNSVKSRLIYEFEKKEAMKVVDIPVAGGWHSPFMESAAKMFRPTLYSRHFTMPHEHFVENYTVDTVRSVEQLKDCLYHHVYCPVKWYPSVRKLMELGIDTFVEIGFSNQLSKFIKYTNRKARVFFTGTAKDLDNTIRALSNSK